MTPDATEDPPRRRNTPRIAPGGWREIGILTSTVAWLSGLVAGTDRPNLFATLGRHRRLAHGWLHFAGTLMPGGRLPRRETELVILRVAHRRDCDYELDHHIHLGRRAGVTARDVDAVTWDRGAPGGPAWSDREAAILAVVDDLIDTRDVDDDTWATAAGLLDERELIELVVLVGHYDMLATTITTLRIQADRRRR
ncbi:MAG: carboxymuconolactone decarboxylase family protein [Actinobacteria bacterium]|nr:carboxymuconolactone decarboxylase family protein [Actinomycetota bacterium]